MPPRMTNEVATARLFELGYEALEEYSYSTKPWRARHLACNHEVTLIWSSVRNGAAPSCLCDAAREAERVRRIAETKKVNNGSGALERMRAAGWEPLEPYPGSHERWRCKCLECGVEGMPKLHGVNKAKGCRSCSGRQLITEQSAGEIMLGAGWRPLVPYPGAREKWLCACVRCGHQSEPNYETTRSGKSGCRMCSARANGLKRRQRFEAQAVRVMLDMQLQPLEPFPGSSKYWLCRCLRCGNMTSPTYGNVSAGGRGCEVCRRKAQGTAKKETFAIAAEEKIRAAGYSPLVPYPGMERPWKCLCRCGRETAVWVSQLGEGSRGCRWCADYGFKMAAPGITYLLVHEQLNAIKVGVTAVGTRRLEAFKRQGWCVAHVERFDTGFEAFSVEKNVLDWWRNDLGLPSYLSPAEMPVGGSSETAELEYMPVHIAVERLVDVAARLRTTTKTVTSGQETLFEMYAGAVCTTPPQTAPKVPIIMIM